MSDQSEWRKKFIRVLTRQTFEVIKQSGLKIPDIQPRDWEKIGDAINKIADIVSNRRERNGTDRPL
jgi:hypothetical protein